MLLRYSKNSKYLRGHVVHAGTYYLLSGFSMLSFANATLFNSILLMAMLSEGSLLTRLFGTGKGSGAACFFAVLGVAGVVTCIVFRCSKHLRAMQTEELKS